MKQKPNKYYNCELFNRLQLVNGQAIKSNYMGALIHALYIVQFTKNAIKMNFPVRFCGPKTNQQSDGI